MSSLLFGLIHLPTYDWNLIQCIVVIGTARMVLTLGWILTKNIWVSTGAHIINDWLLFGVGLVGILVTASLQALVSGVNRLGLQLAAVQAAELEDAAA